MTFCPTPKLGESLVLCQGVLPLCCFGQCTAPSSLYSVHPSLSEESPILHLGDAPPSHIATAEKGSIRDIQCCNICCKRCHNFVVFWSLSLFVVVTDSMLLSPFLCLSTGSMLFSRDLYIYFGVFGVVL